MCCVSVESSVSSGESVSCFSSSGHSCSSVIGGDCDHAQSEAPVIGVKKVCAHNHECSMKPTNPPGQTRDHSCTTVRHTDLSVLIVLMEFLHCALPFLRHLSYFIAIFQLCWDLEYSAYLYFHLLSLFFTGSRDEHHWKFNWSIAHRVCLYCNNIMLLCYQAHPFHLFTFYTYRSCETLK